MDADRTNALLLAIDGALADPEMPDGMRWHPDPENSVHPDPENSVHPAPLYGPDPWPLRTPDCVSEALAAAVEAAARRFVEIMRDTAEAVEAAGPAWARLGEQLREAGVAVQPGPPPRPPAGRAEVLAAALTAKRSGAGAGPPRPGPERTRAPRRHQ